MTVLNKLLEALCRIEHKLDQLMLSPATQGWNWDLMKEGTPCPLCHESVRYLSDIENGVVFRQCGCTHGKQPGIPIAALAPVAPGGEANEEAVPGTGNESGQDDGGGHP